VVPRVETEIGVRLGRPLRGPDVDADEARDAVCEVFLALEVIDTRYGAWQIALEDSVADNASVARAVVGAAARRPFLVGQTTGTLSDRAGLLCPSYRADTGHGGRA